MLAGCAFGISVVGHVAAGGEVHVTLGLLLGAFALVAVCLALTERRSGFAAIFVTVGLAQPILHLLSSLGGHGYVGSSAPAGLDLDDLTAVGTPSEPAVMVMAHLIAAVVISLLLADGERLLWSLYERVRLVLPVRLRPVTPVPRTSSARSPRRWTEPLQARELLLVRAAPRRGPPAVSITS